jgi:hypothetical protein
MKSRFAMFDFRLLAGIALLAGVSIWLVSGTTLAQSEAKKLGPNDGSGTVDPLTELKVVEEVRAATTRGLDYLRSKQTPNGSWNTNNAINALALLAFLGRGHTPGRGPYRDVLEKGKKYILSTAMKDSGYLGTGGGRMYEHGLATLALAEMYGMDPDPELEKVLRKAVELIEKCQAPNGGWRYEPRPADADLSVTVMQIVALRAANNADIPVKEQVINKAIAYVKSCASPAGGYGYAGPGQGGPTSAAGTLSLQLLGQYNDPTVPKALEYIKSLKASMLSWNAGGYFFYFHYYAVQANYQAGGKFWDEWHPEMRNLFLNNQQKDGSWDHPGNSSERGAVDPNKVYSTAMACVILDIYMHFLPAYQR